MTVRSCRRAWLSIATLWLAATPALATAIAERITFDDNTQWNVDDGVFDSGYRFAGLAGTVVVLGTENTQGAFNGTPSLVAFRDPMAMQRRDGQAFTLLAMDIGLYGIGPSSELPPGTQTVAVSATLELAAGGESVQAIEVGMAYERWSFGDDVLRVRFEQPFGVNLRFDNIDVLSPVPEPAGWMLLLAGGALLGAWRAGRGGPAGLRPRRGRMEPAA